ncbi:MAG: ComEC/Rec2 family competence protein [Actinomycetota bacterium]
MRTPRTRAVLAERPLLALAVAAWLIARWAGHIGLPPVIGSPLVFVVAIALVAVLSWRQERIAGTMCAILLLVGAQAAWAWQRLDVEVAREPSTVPLVLRSDPRSVPGGVRVEAGIDGAVYDLRAWGSPAGWMRNRLVGERVQATVRLRPLDPDAPTWLRARGVVGRGTVVEVSSFAEGRVHTRLANHLRRTIESGARSLSSQDRALFTGLVYGDDRRQSPLVADDFAASGLTHLLAVSGQNVAFVLALGGPLLRRLEPRGRFAVVLGLLLLFATMTRFEASVVRASMMAAIGSVGALVGTDVPARRVLLLTVIALIVLDPLLVHSVAFQLSLAASAGILLWSGRVALAIPGPRPFAESLAVTLTAQLAVAPLLLWRFGPVPVASIPANLLAGPAAGPAMMWGMTGGTLAGLLPGSLARLLHAPTTLLVGWIGGVASWSARLPLGEVGGWGIVICFAAGRFALGTADRSQRAVAGAVIVLVLAAPAVVSAGSPAPNGSITGGGSILSSRDRTVVYLDQVDRPEDVLRDLRRARVDGIDVLVVARSSFAAADLVEWVGTRHELGVVFAPEATLGVGEVVPVGPMVIRIAMAGVRCVTIELDPEDPRGLSLAAADGC